MKVNQKKKKTQLVEYASQKTETWHITVSHHMMSYV